MLQLVTHTRTLYIYCVCACACVLIMGILQYIPTSVCKKSHVVCQSTLHNFFFLFSSMIIAGNILALSFYQVLRYLDFKTGAQNAR